MTDPHAQRSSYAAEQALLQLQGALLGAHVDLARALGGGWSTPGDARRPAGDGAATPRQ